MSLTDCQKKESRYKRARFILHDAVHIRFTNGIIQNSEFFGRGKG